MLPIKTIALIRINKRYIDRKTFSYKKQNSKQLYYDEFHGIITLA